MDYIVQYIRVLFTFGVEVRESEDGNIGQRSMQGTHALLLCDETGDRPIDLHNNNNHMLSHSRLTRCSSQSEDNKT